MRGPNVFIAALALGLAGCWQHVFPIQTAFPAASDGVHARVFADANGTLYPDGWDAFVKPHRPWRADSLLNEAADDPALLDRITAEEQRQLDAIADLVRDKQRIFILVHGYNNRVDETDVPYDRIEARIAPQPTDAVIRLNWDGLTGSGAGGAEIWFAATGYSQLVGMRALRAMLNRMTDKDIYVIAHSRGASVTLSALSDPPFDPRFRARTEAVIGSWPGRQPDLFAPPPLAENGNRIRVLLLAPAIDRIDFCRPEETGGCSEIRPISRQLCSVRYTVNKDDPVLRKFVGLQGNFNPTRLGQDLATGRYLETHGARFLQPPAVFAAKFHHFADYVERPEFDRLLAAMLAERSCG